MAGVETTTRHAFALLLMRLGSIRARCARRSLRRNGSLRHPRTRTPTPAGSTRATAMYNMRRIAAGMFYARNKPRLWSVDTEGNRSQEEGGLSAT